MDRKTFIQKSAGALLLAAPAYALLNCSSSDDSNPPQGGNMSDCIANGTASAIGSNHGHSLTVSAADINAGVNKTYDIQGSSGHPHQVTITAAQFASLGNNQAVNATSTSDAGHTHSITVSCA